MTEIGNSKPGEPVWGISDFEFCASFAFRISDFARRYPFDVLAVSHISGSRTKHPVI